MLTLSLLFLVACGEKGKEETKTENTQKKTLQYHGIKILDF